MDREGLSTPLQAWKPTNVEEKNLPGFPSYPPVN